MKFAEVLNSDGTINQKNLRSAQQTDRYILKGENIEKYEPRFTYHGCRCLEISYIGSPELLKVKGHVVHTSFEPTSCVESTIQKYSLGSPQSSSKYTRRLPLNFLLLRIQTSFGLALISLF